MRQRRDKTEPEKASDDDHHGIPRDAEGAPVFLILPPTLQAQYEEQMRACEAAWRVGEPLAVAEATTCTHNYRQPIPKWLERAVVELVMRGRSDQQAQRYDKAQIRLMRYMAVRDLKFDISQGKARRFTNISWEETYERAAESLVQTSAAGSAATMKADYARVLCDLKAGHSGKYFNLKDRRYRCNGFPDLTPRSKPPFGPKTA
jgi:hypothetical protein